MKERIELRDANSIEREACAWIAQLDGDAAPSEQDLEALREWGGRSPRHLAELQRLCRLWGQLNVLTELSVPPPKYQQNSGPAIWISAAVSLAILLVVLGVSELGTEGSSEPSWNEEYVTAVGEQRLVEFADGSTMLLNTDTLAQVEYGDEFRNIHLLRGQAHFNVTHEPERPFQVFASSGLITAVGTAFSVLIRRSEIEVTVTEGRVELASVQQRDPAATSRSRAPVTEKLAMLGAGQNARFSDRVESLLVVDDVELERMLSWHDGMLEFSGETLEEVVGEVSRYTPLTIEFLDPGVRDFRIGGQFKVGEINAMFEALEDSFGVKVSRIGEKTVLLSAAESAKSH